LRTATTINPETKSTTKPATTGLWNAKNGAVVLTGSPPLLESEESSLHDPREHIEEYRRLFCSAPNPFYSAAAYYGDKAKSSGIAPGGFAV
jgi:hypothetical protein